MAMFHEGNRDLQDHFGSRALADRLNEKLGRDRFTDDDKTFIESSPFFFMATADAEGHPDCSFKGGVPGFVRVVAPDTLVFPDYDGNGMFKSLGNLKVNANVGLLFISMTDKPKRLRGNGEASLVFEDPLLEGMPGGQLLVRVTPRHIFPNCPRNVPNMALVAPSIYVPKAGLPPVEPAWTGFDASKSVVPNRTQ